MLLILSLSLALQVLPSCAPHLVEDPDNYLVSAQREVLRSSRSSWDQAPAASGSSHIEAVAALDSETWHFYVSSHEQAMNDVVGPVWTPWLELLLIANAEQSVLLEDQERRTSFSDGEVACSRPVGHGSAFERAVSAGGA